ncbi:hypothetical protein Taro_025777 [Colocasia esculenta]|uniref:Uncharacterized protein n=1 Tax=Colocasia esculenta TaxID=4460 RepID=A0A843VA81_COLES|nr:hypothetical protein [Colocasia esculenta]
MLRERNFGAGPKISEPDLVSVGSKCQFRIGSSLAIPITGRRNIHVLLKGCDNQCTSTHAPQQNFGLKTEFYETSVLMTVSECRFRIVV